MPGNNCPVHTPQPCCEGPCEHEVMTEPTEEELIQELVQHLKKGCPQMCSYCFEEFEIRSMGQEAFDAMEAYYLAQEKEMCSCS